ncbi:MAG TPA: hypothetical protein ENH00_14005 [Actinobacteria bacterium]|nr:hypothetical protein [Actinomycetota bacterium]
MATAVPWWRRLTPGHLVLLVPWIGLVVGAASPIRDNSFLWHVRAGTLQLDLGHVLRTDPFSFTMQGAPWRTQSWLLELGYGLLERWTNGLGWVPVMLVVVGTLTFLLVALTVHRRARSLFVTGTAMAFFTWLGLAFQVPRPVLVSFLLLALLVVMVDRGVMWGVPLVLWAWASVHGSWVLGLGYVALEALASRRSWKPVVRTLVASLIGVSITAHGLGVWEILGAFFRSRDALRLITEWAVPDILSVPNLPYALGIVALLVATARGGIETRKLWLIVPFLLFGLTSERSLFPAAIVLVPWTVLAASARQDLVRLSPRRAEAVVNVVIAVVILVAPFAAFVGVPLGIDSATFPIQAARHLTEGRVWSDDQTGGFLIYAYWPEREVFIDDRAELYGAAFMRELVQTRNGDPVWRDVFEQQGIDQALARSDSGIGRALDGAGWDKAFEASTWAPWVGSERRD